MPDTFDLQRAFDDLTDEVTRAVGPGDADRPIRTARRRRAVAGVAALAVATTLGVVGVTQLTGADPDASTPGYADGRTAASPGAARRARLLALVPPGGTQVSLVDVVGFRGEPGVDYRDPGDRELPDYILSSFIKLQRGPLDRLLLPELVTYAGTSATDVFLIDRTADAVTDRMVRAGWEDDEGVLVPGDGVPTITAETAPYLQVTEEAGQALVVIARDRKELPDLGSTAPPEPGLAASRLVELGGAVGYAVDFEAAACTFHAVSLTSPTEASMLLGPPAGTAAEDVSLEDLTVPDAITSIDAVSAAGDLVRAEVTVESPDAPLQLLRRLGLPGTEFC